MLRRLKERFLRSLVGPPASRAVLPRPVGQGGVVFGGMEIPARRIREPHYLFLGMTDSGKSLLVHSLMRSCLATPHRAPRHRALVYDAKQEAYSILAGFLDRRYLVVLNPFDARCTPWDVARDVDSEATACQMADILCPSRADGGDNWFFDCAARGLLSATFDALRQRRPEGWSLHDALHRLSSADRAAELLRHTEFGRRTLENYLDHRDPKTPQNVMATVWQRISPYRTIAALWVRSRNAPLSLADWATSREASVLILPRNRKHSATLDPIVRCMFERTSQLVTSRPDDDNHDLTWFFLDEIARAPYLGDALLELLALGRGKGARCVLAMQDIDLLKSEELYGDTAEAMLAQCGNVTIAKLNSVSTREWAAGFVGEHRYVKVSRTYNESVRGPTTVSETHSTEEERIMLPAEFGELPLPAKGVRGPTAVFSTPEFGIWRGTVASAFLDASLPTPSSATEDRGFVGRPVSDQAPIEPSPLTVTAPTTEVPR